MTAIRRAIHLSILPLALLSAACVVLQEFVLFRKGIHWSPSALCLTLFVLALITSRFKETTRHALTSPMFILTILLACATFAQSLLYAHFSSEATGASPLGKAAYKSATIVFGSIFFLITAYVHQHSQSERARRLLNWFVLGGMITAVVVAILHAFFGLEAFEPLQMTMKRPIPFTDLSFFAWTGLIAKRGGYTALCIVAMAIATGLLFSPTIWRKITGLILILSYMFAIFLSGSRTAYAAAVFFMGTAFILYAASKYITKGRRKSVSYLLALTIFTSVAIVGCGYIPQNVNMKSKIYRSLEHRFFQNKIAVDAILTSPLYGNGINFEKEKYLNNFTIHNTHLAMASTHGLPIALIYVLLWGIPLFGFVRLYISRNDPRTRLKACIWIGSFTAVFIIACFSNMILSYVLWLFFAVAHLELLSLQRTSSAQA